MIDIVEKLHEHARCAETRNEIEMCDAAIKEITRLREENARLLEALKPFAARLDELEKLKASKYACATPVEIEHLRAARAAIREKRSFATEGGKE